MVQVDESEAKVCLNRQTANYKDFVDRFYSDSDSYIRQFAGLYTTRIEEFRPILKEKACKKWGNEVEILLLADMENHSGKCIIIGTLFKHQPNKPSVLKELSEDNQLNPPAPKPDYCSDDDQLFLEDQTSRIRLSGEKVDIKKSVTGVVCAVFGQENANSTFEVEDWCFAGCPSPSLPISPKKSSSGKIVFISGLELATNPAELPMMLLLEWLQGFAGYKEIQEESASVVRVVIAGNSIKGTADSHVSKGLVSGKAEDAAASRDMTNGIQKLDEFLATLGMNCYITLMPGQYDVATLMMPQRSMHPGSFPKAKCLNTIKGVSNPWVGQVNDKTVIGTSGQPINDLHKVCGIGICESIELLENTLEWRHMCPTAPDTIPCVPFHKNDPFIIKECPSVYFAGNMEKFDTKLYTGSQGQKVRLLCIPKFSKTHTVVIVDLNTLDATPITFGCD